MPLKISQMAEGTDIDPSVFVSALEALMEEALTLKVLIERDHHFYLLPAIVSRMDMHMMAIKSGFSVMVLTCLKDGVDFIAQDSKGVAETNDRSTGEDPLDGAGLPPGEVDGEPAGAEASDSHGSGQR